MFRTKKGNKIAEPSKRESEISSQTGIGKSGEVIEAQHTNRHANNYIIVRFKHNNGRLLLITTLEKE